jgi:hypothetical protein
MASMTKTPAVNTSEEIVNQGSVPFKKTENVATPSVAKGLRGGEQTARGFGLQMRATKFVVR